MYSRIQNTSQNNSINISSHMNTLTAEKISRLHSTINDPNGDYFTGTVDEQKAIVREFVVDNSNSDSAYLYIAANTAFKIGDLKDAAFLFYAAQLRKHFDYRRFNLGVANGNNIQTYLGFLNETTGASINPAIMRSPTDFSGAIDMIEKWQVIPSDTALYPKEEYYTANPVSKDQYQIIADETKKDFMEGFGNKYKNILNDPKKFEAIIFMQDYNFGKIPQNPENDARYQEYTILINQV